MVEGSRREFPFPVGSLLRGIEGKREPSLLFPDLSIGKATASCGAEEGRERELEPQGLSLHHVEGSTWHGMGW